MGFSFASVVLGYFLVAGGTFLTTLLSARLGLHNEYLLYIIMAVGAFVGGFLAARASHHSTIIEPALGAVLMVLSIVGIGYAASSSETRSVILLPASMKGIGLTAAASAGGGILGAFISEKLLGKSTTSTVPWLVYAGVAAFGAAVIGTIFGGYFGKGDGNVLLAVVGVCCLLVGGTAGASARTRPLLATLLGGAIGTGAYFYLAYLVIAALFSRVEGTDAGMPKEAYVGLAVIAGGAGIATMIGAIVGWAAVGKHAARA